MTTQASFFTPSGKVIVVIGGSGKVGRHIVESLFECGSKVICVSRNTPNKDFITLFKNPNKHGGLHFFNCDVTTEDGIESLINFLKKNNFSPDVLVNALSYRHSDTYLSDAIAKWDEVVLKNSRSMYMLFRKFADLMASNGGGSVINFSTIYAVVAPDPSLYLGLNMGTEADYPFIKGGGISLARYFASYYGSKGVRFNSIILGGIFSNQEPKFVERYAAKVPLGRMASGGDVCGLVHLLASDASAYITGASIPVDGGYTLR